MAEDRAIWDSYLSERDRMIMSDAGYGTPIGFGRRPALLVVDVTYGFTGDRPEPIHESIKRWYNSCGEEAWVAIGVIRKLIDVCHLRSVPVLYTSGQYRADKWDLGSWRWKTSRSTEEGPRPDLDPDEIVAAIRPEPQDLVIRKKKPSAFFETSLRSYLQLLGCDSLVVTGTSTSGCVRASVVDAFSMNYRVCVVQDGCFDRSEVSHAVTLFDLNSKYADVVPSDAALKFLMSLDANLYSNLPTTA